MSTWSSCLRLARPDKRGQPAADADHRAVVFRSSDPRGTCVVAGRTSRPTAPMSVLSLFPLPSLVSNEAPKDALGVASLIGQE